VIKKQLVPKQFIDTSSLPSIPDAKMQSEVSSYIVDLWDSAFTCKQNMRAIENFIGEEKNDTR